VLDTIAELVLEITSGMLVDSIFVVDCVVEASQIKVKE